MMDKRLEIVERLKSLEAYLCTGKRSIQPGSGRS